MRWEKRTRPKNKHPVRANSNFFQVATSTLNRHANRRRESKTAIIMQNNGFKVRVKPETTHSHNATEHFHWNLAISNDVPEGTFGTKWAKISANLLSIRSTCHNKWSGIKIISEDRRRSKEHAASAPSAEVWLMAAPASLRSEGPAMMNANDKLPVVCQLQTDWAINSRVLVSMDPGLQHHQGRLIRWLRLERQQQSGSPMEAWKLSSGIMYWQNIFQSLCHDSRGDSYWRWWYGNLKFGSIWLRSFMWNNVSLQSWLRWKDYVVRPGVGPQNQLPSALNSVIPECETQCV